MNNPTKNALGLGAPAKSGVGPKGGNLEQHHAERRRAGLDGTLVEGLPALHRFERGDAAFPGLKNEQPWHRMAAFMLLAGRTNSEIAMAADKEVQTVSNLRGQRWFQDLLAVLANETGADIIGLLNAEAQDSLNMMISVRDDEEAPARLRYTAAKDILELSHGKAVQRVVSHTTHSSTTKAPDEEMNDLVTELAALRARHPSN